MLFSKVFRGITLSGALLFAAGCGLFDNSTPTEDLYPVPQAEMDPGFNPDDFGNGTFGPGGAGNPETPSPDWGEPTEEGMAYIGMEDLSVLTDINFPVIYFNFDADSLNPSEQAKLDAVAEYMNQAPELYLIVEGHCDERGTNEYNRALGERRAIAVKNYLTGRGMAADHVRTISYGEDKPAVSGHDEAAYAKNRRGELLAAKKIK
ncbi:peptidoglycan-associated lipoprotein Pal [Victivallis sp. Marseille-Q1083]|uniref:peptidoglycan-associated lipoprotein Pal n=1 Tax=Victivallis sp. Marseille-Q1083 TaxID=2717288 RepID=UPI0034C5EC5F